MQLLGKPEKRYSSNPGWSQPSVRALLALQRACPWLDVEAALAKPPEAGNPA